MGGGQSVSVMTKVGGTSCRELGMRVGLVLSCMVEVEMVCSNFIAFYGEVEFISPVQILIIQGGWQLVEKKNSEKILEPENK